MIFFKNIIEHINIFLKKKSNKEIISLENNIDNEEIFITLNVSKGVHIKPRYYNYKGGFDNINTCTVCNRTALYEDMHKNHPCPTCGGEIKERAFIGIWDEKRKKWLKREEYFEKDIQNFQNNLKGDIIHD